jgi:muramoyltetrapeptide carboxypeptidase
LTPRIPPFIKKGDEIRIISTARKISAKELEPAVNFLKLEGYKVSFGKNLFKVDQQFAGNDKERASDLQDALDDTDVKVIWLARGGYGTHRLIEQVILDGFIRNPKWIVGYSDVTVLHSFIYRQTNISTLHATMPVNFLNQT